LFYLFFLFFFVFYLFVFYLLVFYLFFICFLFIFYLFSIYFLFISFILFFPLIYIPLGTLNDIWAFNTTSKLWQWKGGSQLADVPPQYTTDPLTLTPPNPGSREGTSTWVEHTESGEDILYLFGGTAGEEMYHNDVWKYNLTSNAWTWVAGSNLTGGGSEYNLSVPGGASPSARSGSASWVGPDGLLYLFGGHRMLISYNFA
jgi:energy-coupling factor transporter transmembrane protein EcfT